MLAASLRPSGPFSSSTSGALNGPVTWTGVRSVFARLQMRAMSVGDEVLFYHSNAEPSAAEGLARVERLAARQVDHQRDRHFGRGRSESRIRCRGIGASGGNANQQRARDKKGLGEV